jgi:hypothetical protein
VKRGNWIQAMPMPDKGYFVLLRFYSPLEPVFTKEWRPSEVELVKCGEAKPMFFPKTFASTITALGVFHCLAGPLHAEEGAAGDDIER